jgi:hypothetical protein
VAFCLDLASTVGNGDSHGVGGVSLWVSVAWGRARVPAGTARARWGFTAVG